MKPKNHFGWKWPLSPCAYILKFSDNTVYFGSTARPLRLRIGEHVKYWGEPFTTYVVCVGTPEYVEFIEQRLIDRFIISNRVRNKPHPGGGLQPHAKTVRRHGITYPSIAAAARVIGIRVDTVRDQIKRGTTIVVS